MFEVGMKVWCPRCQNMTLATQPFTVISRTDYMNDRESTYILRYGNITLMCRESDLVFARLGDRAAR